MHDSSTFAASAAAVRLCMPYMQGWRRRSPSYTSIRQAAAPCRAVGSGSVTEARTVGRSPASAGNTQYR
ncbi:hypothetical protein [Streptomyces zhihengii]